MKTQITNLQKEIDGIDLVDCVRFTDAQTGIDWVEWINKNGKIERTDSQLKYYYDGSLDISEIHDAMDEFLTKSAE